MTEHKTLAEALAAFQQDVPHVKKDRTAQVRSDKGNYSYTYADLADVTAAALPALARHGLSFSCKPTLDEDGNFVLAYVLRHAGSDEVDTGSYPLPKTGTPQQIGSSISYGRRYVMSAVTGIVADEDDDGKAGGDAPVTAAQRRPAQAPRRDAVEKAKTQLRELTAARKLDATQVAERYEKQYGEPLKQATDVNRVAAFTKLIEDEKPAEAST